MRYWYRSISRKLIKFKIETPKRLGSIPSYITTWRISDPIEELDVRSSLEIMPILIPGVTTKKWVRKGIYGVEEGKSIPDLLIVIDSSGSMDWEGESVNIRSKSPYHLALIGAFAALYIASKKNAYVAVINFSSGYRTCPWTREIVQAENTLLAYQGGGTTFPVAEFIRIINMHEQQRRNVPILVLIITDSEIYNWDRTERKIIEILENEKKAERVYLNISTSTKLCAVAFALAAIEYDNALLYYVVPEQYNIPPNGLPFSSGAKRVEVFSPKIKVKFNEWEKEILKVLANYNVTSLGELNKILAPDDVSKAMRAKLSYYVRKLQQKGYVEFHPGECIKLTELGLSIVKPPKDDAKVESSVN